jgi:hypothetical protein
VLITTRNEASFVVQQHDPSFQRDKDEISCSAVLLREIFQGPDSVSGSVVLLLTMQYDKSLLERFAYKRVALIFQCSTWGLRDMLDASSESEKCSRRYIVVHCSMFHHGIIYRTDRYTDDFTYETPRLSELEILRVFSLKIRDLNPSLSDYCNGRVRLCLGYDSSRGIHGSASASVLLPSYVVSHLEDPRKPVSSLCAN